MGDALRMLARVGRETLSHHSDADGDIDRYLFARTTRVGDYATYLVRVYGFVAAVESAITDTPDLGDIIDLEVRAKTPRLVQDLFALGLTPAEVSNLPICRAVPAVIDEAAAALGWLYVIERPMLAGSLIVRHLATRLPVEMISSSSYLACHAGHIGKRWRELGEAMERVAANGTLADRIVGGGREGFRALQRWRTHDLQETALAV